jgi:predicted PurR-regulated permease PerM
MRPAALAQAHDTQQSRKAIAAAAVGASLMAALAVGRPVLVPLALAAIFAFALDPLVTLLMRARLSRWCAIAVAVSLAASVVFAVALFASDQIGALAQATPHRAGVHQPVPLWIAGSLAEPLTNPVTSAGFAVLVAAFLLWRKDVLAAHFSRFAAGDGALAASARQFTRTLLVQGTADVTYGVSVALGLWAMGIPDAGLWALLGVMLRSVPFVGVAVAAACPLMLTVSLDPTVFTVCATLLLFFGVDLALILARRKLGAASVVRLTPAAAVGVTVGWTCLWGLAGLLLAIPVTLGIALIGRHFVPFAFLDGLIADPEAPRPATRILHKLPFAKPCAVQATAEASLQELLALQRSLRALDAERRAKIRQAIAALTATAPASPDPDGFGVVCVAGPGTMDQVGAGLLAQALRRKGFASRVVAFEATAPDALSDLALSDARAVCMSCLDPEDYAELRRLVRRLRPRAPEACFVAGLWGWHAAQLMDAGPTECDLVAASPDEAAEQLARLARRQSRPRAEDVFTAELALAAA